MSRHRCEVADEKDLARSPLSPGKMLALAAYSAAYAPPALGLRHAPGLRRGLTPMANFAEPPTVSEPAASTADAVEQMNSAALLLSDPASIKPTRGPDGRLEPILTLPGDTLETTKAMQAITAASTVVVLLVIARAFTLSSSPLWPLLALAFGGVAGELFSGCFHWATDNCKSSRACVPVTAMAWHSMHPFLSHSSHRRIV